MVTRVASLTDKAGTQLKEAIFKISPARRLRVAMRKNSNQNKMEEADSGQPKAKKKKTEKGYEKR